MDTYTGVFHAFIAHKLKEKCKPFSNIVKRTDAKKVLYNNHVPISLHQKFLEEMQGFKLIKILNKQNIKLMINGAPQHPNIETVEKLIKEGKTQREIANELGVSECCISRLLNKE